MFDWVLKTPQFLGFVCCYGKAVPKCNFILRFTVNFCDKFSIVI